MAMKDVVTCEKLRLVGSERKSVDVRMGQPGTVNSVSSDHYFDFEILFLLEIRGQSSGQRQTWRTETSKYPQEEKVITIPLVAASEWGRA